jgi:DNA-binding response OmpR family regulator
MATPTALIIEDDPQLSQVFSLALTGQFTTQVIDDGYAALALLEEIAPDIVVLDLHLPQVSGSQILDFIRSTARLDKTRVIVTTADARQGEYLQNQADIVLIKPVNPVQLRELAMRLHATTA